MSRKLTLAASVVMAAALAQNAISWAQDDVTVPADQIFTVTKTEGGSVSVLGGTVIPIRVVNLLAQMPGEVEFIAGSEGDAFKEGDKLVTVDIGSLLAKRQAAEAALNSAQAGLGNAIVQYNREVLTPNSQANSMLGGMPGMFSTFMDPMRSMMGQGNPGYERGSNIYGQGVQVRTAQDQIQQALAAIRELDENVKNASAVAPFDGVVLNKMVEVGDVVQPGMPLMVFGDKSLLQIQVEVPSRLLRGLKEGGMVQARVDHGEEITVTVDRIFPSANQGGHTTTVKFGIPESTPAHPGMYAEVLVNDPSSMGLQTLVIPDSSINWRGSLPAVFLVSADRAVLTMRTIRLGPPNGDGKRVVLSGLAEGDTILKAPLASTRSGPYQANTL
ncbi:MAG: efflux RND transporter periplasmic adaptor subunit [Chromatiales bacterium]|nr:efflux RND transporter periplasmic adaptor subunit [Chromatiales bacterium]